MEGMGANTDVVGIFSNVLGKMLVDGNTACLECLGGDLLLLVAHKMGNEGEHINGCLFGTHVVNPDLGFGHTTAVPRLDVRLVLLVTVAPGWTTTHFELFAFDVRDVNPKLSVREIPNYEDSIGSHF
mmetsp:Transcript_20380/g.26861  ORF Transcript_20380/g.26861 Transcript_20380/m.26861 type:complete len:127 (-) Transcript_20380:70-450(-)